MAGGRIFINYRREDTGGYARSLFDRINARFPKQVFMDVGGSIEFGLDFAEEIRKAVSSCDALIVLIGRHWLNVRDASGRRRLDDPGDFVALEIATALKRNVRVVPALVGGTSMPSEEDLPPDLKPLTRRQAVLLSDQDWDHTVQRLIKTLEGALSAQAKAAPRKLTRAVPKRPAAWLGSGALAALLLIVAVVYRVTHRQLSLSATSSSPPTASASPAAPATNPPAGKPESPTTLAPDDARKVGSPVSFDKGQSGVAGTNKKAAILQATEARQAAGRAHTKGATNASPSGAAITGKSSAESFDALVLDGDLAYESGEYQKALNKYLRAYRMGSENKGLRRRIATALTLLGRPEEAQRYQ